jgi:hypothetical protein
MKAIWGNVIFSMPGRATTTFSRLSQRFGNINRQAGVLTAIFRRIEPLVVAPGT